MLILMSSGHTKKQLADVLARVRKLRLKPHVIPGNNLVAVGITGNALSLDPPEPFRCVSVIESVCAGRRFGKGLQSYLEAIDVLISLIEIKK